MGHFAEDLEDGLAEGENVVDARKKRDRQSVIGEIENAYSTPDLAVSWFDIDRSAK